MKKFYSNHLGEIEDQRFQAALDKFELGRLLGSEGVPHGFFGQNVFLDTTKGRFVFRGRGQFRNERYMAERLHAETKAPVPWPYLLDESNEIFEWPYAIMPRMPGLPLESRDVQAGLSADDRMGIAGAMGDLLRELQKLKHPHCGAYDEEADMLAPLGATYIPPWEKKSPEDSAAASGDGGSSIVNYQKWIASRIRWHMDKAVEENDASKGRVTTPGDLEWLETLIEDSREALAEPFQPCFVMEDFKEGNTVATKENGQWKITGVFDLGMAYFGDEEADVSRILLMYGMGNPEPSPSALPFLKAYLRATTCDTLRRGFLERVKLYFLMNSAIFWYFFRKRGNYDTYPDFRSWYGPQLEAFDRNLRGMLQDIFATPESKM